MVQNIHSIALALWYLTIVQAFVCISYEVWNCCQLVSLVRRNLFRTTATLTGRLVWGRTGESRLATIEYFPSKESRCNIFVPSEKWLGEEIHFAKKLQLQRYDRWMQASVQGCRNCWILPSRRGEHGVSLENMGNMENIEKMEKVNQMTQKSPEDFWRRRASLHMHVDV